MSFSSCPIPNSQGPVIASGPVDAPILLLGEAGGRTEGRLKKPFCGEAGYELDRLLQVAKIDRDQCRIANTIACSPPSDWLVGAPWETAALRHCEPQLNALLAEWVSACKPAHTVSVVERPGFYRGSMDPGWEEPTQEIVRGTHINKVVVPLGGTALRAIMGLPRARGKEAAKVQDFHGAPVRDARGFWVCPTYHPSFNSRSARKYSLCMNFDLTVARELAEGKWEPDEPELVIDPSPEWFSRWTAEYLAGDHSETLLAVDIETPDKQRSTDESELGKEDKSYQILYCNFACSDRQGITVPWVEPYVSICKRLIEGGGALVFHNANYDVRRLRAAGVHIDQSRIHDSMDAWHVLYSSLPRGLGFVAPFFSKRGPWKHLGSLSGEYRALDGVQTWRVMRGCFEELASARLSEVYLRHMHSYDVYVLKPAEEEGLGFSRERLQEFTVEMQGVCERIDQEVQPMIPEEVRDNPLLLEGPYVREISSSEGVSGEILRRDEATLIQACTTCGAQQVSKKHRCEDRELIPKVELVERVVPRWWRRKPFKPSSPEQVRAVILAKGHKPGKNRKTKEDTTDKKTLLRLVKTGDPFYRMLLNRRDVGKMRGLGEGTIQRLDILDRVHTTFTHVPSTARLASTEPNLQNVANHVPHAAAFRRAVVAQSGCRLMSFDYGSIEAVMTGYFCGDPDFIRLSKLSIHAYHASAKVGMPTDLSWSDADLLEHFGIIKKKFEPQYQASKRCIYLTLYGGTPNMMRDQYPEVFPSLKSAKDDQALLYELCPKLKKWHAQTRELAHRQKYLGGPGAHPFGYKHWFFAVLSYRNVKGVWVEALGDDAKKAVAFYPQSAAAGTICEAALALLTPGAQNYIGDCGPGGRTPLRAIIHDDLTFEVRDEMADYVRAAVIAEMTRGIEEMPCPEEWGLGSHLTVGVAAKEGMNWAPWSESNLDGMRGVESVADDSYYEEEEDEDSAD